MGKRAFCDADVDPRLFEYKAAAELELAAFDRLPWEVRQCLRNAPIPVSAMQAENLIRQGAPGERVCMMVWAMVRQWRERQAAGVGERAAA